MKQLLFALLVLQLFGACASTPAPVKPLPFHVAIVPMDSGNLTRKLPLEREGSVTSRVEPDTAALSAAIASALDERGLFTRVSLLEAALEAPASPEEWALRAQDIGADLMLICDLSYSPEVWQERNGNFWLNIPLFTLGGPFTYFVKDRTYYADVELRGRFYDLEARELFRIPAPLERQDMNFVDRAGGNLGAYALSFLIPSGFLSKDGKGVQGEIDERIPESLVDVLSNYIVSQRTLFYQPDQGVPFYIDPATVAVRTPEGARLEGDIWSLTELWKLSVDDSEPVEASFTRSPTAQGGGANYVAYRIPDHVAKIDEQQNTVQVRITANPRTPFTRSFTLPVQ